MNLLELSKMIYRIDYNTYLKSFDTTFPLFLQDKNVSPDEYLETIEFISKRTQEILYTSKAFTWLIWTAALTLPGLIFGGGMTLAGVFTTGVLQS